MFFLIDEKYSLTYEEILQHVNTADFYTDCYIYPNLKSFFLNWIFALANDRHIALMDSDISQKEIDSNELTINQLVKIDQTKKSVL